MMSANVQLFVSTRTECGLHTHTHTHTHTHRRVSFFMINWS